LQGPPRQTSWQTEGPYKPCTGHTGHCVNMHWPYGCTGRILYTWPYYTPSKRPSNCPKC